jgi:hypothetical protein
MLWKTALPHSDMMELVQIMVQIASLWVNETLHISWSGQPPPSTARKRYTPASSAATTPTVIGGTTTLSQGVSSQSASSQASPSASVLTTSGGTIHHSGLPPQDTLWVIFGMRTLSEFVDIENIEMSNMLTNDPAFFQELRRLEKKHRRTIIQWLSPFIFAYCKFVQVCTPGRSWIHPCFLLIF